MTHRRFFNRVLRVAFALLMFMALVPSTVAAAEDWSYPTSKPSSPFGGGKGTQDNPYLIKTAQHLANLAYMVTHGTTYSGCYFKLANDITLNDGLLDGANREVHGYAKQFKSWECVHYAQNVNYFDSKKSWQPIGIYGSSSDKDFKGIFDGDGHTISGIYCRQPAENTDNAYRHMGLFGNCKDARISNLTIKDSFFSLTDGSKVEDVNVGVLVGLAKNTILTNCHVENSFITGDGTISIYKWAIGGLVGKGNSNFTANNCSFSGGIDAYPIQPKGKPYKNTERGGYYYVGGLAGNLDDATTFDITDCRTDGALLMRESYNTFENSAIYVGGLVGKCTDGDTDAALNKKRLTRCVNRASMEVTQYAIYAKLDNNVHGIVGGAAYCRECANFGVIRYGCDEQVYDDEEDEELSPRNNRKNDNVYIYLGGICKYGKADDCFDYGNLSFNLSYANNAYFDPFVSRKGTATNCFASLAVDEETDHTNLNSCFRTDLIAKNEDVKYNNVNYYIPVTTIEIWNNITQTYNLTFNNVVKDYFTSQETVGTLNTNTGSYKYGRIKDDNDSFDDYLLLTSLGATINALTGEGTASNPYLVSTASDLKILYDLCESGQISKDNLFKLANNIDMTNEPAMEAIGSESHPFVGTFEGAGHFIRGLKSYGGCLFGVMNGTVRQLALDGLKTQNVTKFAGIADQVGSGCTISECYVVGDVNLRLEGTRTDAVFGGICNTLGNNATIQDCYYIGNVKVTNNNTLGDPANVKVGGIVATSNGHLQECYASIGYSTAGKSINATVGGIAATLDASKTINKNVYYLNIPSTAQQPTVNTYSGVTQKTSESDIKAEDVIYHRDFDYWTQGKYHPVLKNAYHYECKDYNGNTVLLDLVPRTPGNNDILTLVPTDEQKADTKMWQLPNVAVYLDEYGAEMLTNFTIVPDTKTDSYPLHYKASKDDVSVKGLVVYPWVVNKNAVNWCAFCLPGEVNLSNLPEGCKLYVGGKLVKDTEGTKNKMNIVEVETVPAGVPFLLRYDNTTDADTLNITMTGTLAMTPQKADESSSLEGTFVGKSGSYAYSNEIVEDATSIHINKANGIACFSAYVPNSSTSRIELTNYLLLDEQSNETDDVIAAHKDKSVNVKLRRSIKKGGWNTVCLPFDVTEADIKSALGADTRIEELTSVTYDANTVVLNFSAASSIEAGKPYLVYPENEVSIFDFGARTICGTAKANTFENVPFGDNTTANISMVGSYGKTALLSTDEESQYFIQQDKFYRVVNDPVVSLGYRCWFKVTDFSGTQSQALSSARIVHADGSATAIKLVDTGLGTGNTRIYDLQGIQHEALQKGVNIVGGKKIIKK